MGNLDNYLNEARNLAEDAGDVAKTIAGDVVSKAKKLTEEGSAARELAKNAKGQAASISRGVGEKVQGILQDNRAGRELRQGMAELEALPEVEGSIIYTMELETAVNYLRSLQLIIDDKRMDADSAAEEIRKVMDKVQPAEDTDTPETDEQQAIENVKAIVYSACARALEALL